MSRGWFTHVVSVLLAPLTLLCLLWSGDPGAMQHDPLLVGEGRRLRLSDLGGADYLMICSPDDCPTCYEFAIAEAGRLACRNPWKDRCALIVVAGSADDTSFAALLRGRYDPPLPLFTAARDSLARLFTTRPLATPCFAARRGDGRIVALRTIAPQYVSEASRFFDSLSAARPSPGGWQP